MSIWKTKRVAICVGAGGVGKTTAAAALALAAAAAGKRTLVMTIDPARRLADALGIAEVGNEPHRLAPELLEAHGLTGAAPLWVMMPDVKATYDALITRLLTDPKRRANLLENPIYRHFSNAIAGSHEYAAVEQLHSAYTGGHPTGAYDFIVLDTPPSQNAVDFLTAPDRITDFLEHNAVSWFANHSARATQFSMRFFNSGGNFVTRALNRMAGADTLRALAEFILAFDGLYAGFAERAQKVRELMNSKDTAFVLVSGPATAQRQAAERVAAEIRKRAMRVDALIINRVRSAETAAIDLITLQSDYHAKLPPAVAPALLEATQEEVFLARRDAEACRDLIKRIATGLTLIFPEQPVDIENLEALVRLERVFG